mgnify:CR=1 FL=1
MVTIETLANKLAQARLSGGTVPQNASEGIDTIEKAIDPSSGEINKQPLNAYRSKRGLGFFGYIFLLIIISFSIIGVIKTFENDLLNYFPEIEYVFEFVDKQLEYIIETVKNIIIIVEDLLNSY